MNNYIIRRIQPEDYHDIHELNIKAGYQYDEEKVKHRIQNILDAGSDFAMVAEKDNKVVGYIHGTPYNTLYSDNLVSIVQMVFSKDTREDRELTSKMMEQFEALAKRNGYAGIRMAADADRKVLYDIMVEGNYENKRDLRHYIKLF